MCLRDAHWGLFLQQIRISCVAMLAAAAILLPQAALAEFDIQEASIEKGEIELEYRVPYHWGAPEATEENENANDLVQSHEFELQYSFTNWLLVPLSPASIHMRAHQNFCSEMRRSLATFSMAEDIFFKRSFRLVTHTRSPIFSLSPCTFLSLRRVKFLLPVRRSETTSARYSLTSSATCSAQIAAAR